MRKKKREIVAIVIVFLCIVGTAAFVYYQAVITAEDDSATTGSLVDDGSGKIAYTDLDGNPVSLDTYKGKVRVVNSWASWCPFCVNELPDFATVARSYDPEEVVFIAINRKETNEKAKAFLRKVGNVDGLIFVQDPNDAFYRSVGGFSMPETIIFDTDGNISTHKRGALTEAELIKFVESAQDVTKQE